MHSEAFLDSRQKFIARSVEWTSRPPPRWLGVTVMGIAFALVTLILIGISA